MKKLTPWQKIVRAGNRGTGTRLSYEDVQRLNMDDAITTRASLDDSGEEPIVFRNGEAVYREAGK